MTNHIWKVLRERGQQQPAWVGRSYHQIASSPSRSRVISAIVVRLTASPWRRPSLRLSSPMSWRSAECGQWLLVGISGLPLRSEHTWNVLFLSASRPRAWCTSATLMQPSMSCLLASTTKMASFNSSSWKVKMLDCTQICISKCYKIGSTT